MRKVLNNIKLVTVVGAIAATMVCGIQSVSAQGIGPGPKACRAGKIVRSSGIGPGPKSCTASKIVRSSGIGPGPK